MRICCKQNRALTLIVHEVSRSVLMVVVVVVVVVCWCWCWCC